MSMGPSGHHKTIADETAVHSILRVVDAVAGYGKHTVLAGVSLEVGEGELVALLGHNGAGKTTMLRSIIGQIALRSGAVRLDGGEIRGSSPASTASLGVSLVPQGQGVFPTMTVEENLRLASASVGRRSDVARTHEEVRGFVEDLFPILGERAKQPAGSLSGGQRQMVAISMSLMMQPRLLLLDEPSTGLAPVLVDEVLAAIAKANRELGTSVLLVEQDINRVLRVVDRVYVIKLGTSVFTGTADEMREQDWSKLF